MLRIPMAFVVLAFALGALFEFVAAPASAEDVEPEVIDLQPDDRASFTPGNLFAPIAAIFRGGTDYYYEPRRVKVDTSPSGGLVDLFYIRNNFQKRFEQAETPVIVLLPPRIEAGDRDALTVRAFAEGFRQKSVTIKVKGSERAILIDLDPLPNTLVALAHRYFGDRSSLSFLTKEALTFRLQEDADGFTVILTETALAPEVEDSLGGVKSPLIDEVWPQQLGEDLLVKISFSERARARGLEPRARERYDPARDLHEFTVDLLPVEGGGAETVAKARSALKSLRSKNVRGCALVYDEVLRDQLDAGALARALAPQGAFTDRYLRAAMRRLGELSPGGVVEFTDGSSYRTAVPIELEIALTQAAEAKGFLALLREWVANMETADHRTETLRSLVAPELAPERFAKIESEAERRQRDCLASR